MVGWAGALFAKQPQPGRAAHPAVAQTESAGVASLKTEYYIRIRLSRKFYEKRYSCGATESRISVHLSPLSTGELWILPRARTLRLHSFSSRVPAGRRRLASRDALVAVAPRLRLPGRRHPLRRRSTFLGALRPLAGGNARVSPEVPAGRRILDVSYHNIAETFQEMAFNFIYLYLLINIFSWLYHLVFFSSDKMCMARLPCIHVFFSSENGHMPCICTAYVIASNCLQLQLYSLSIILSAGYHVRCSFWCAFTILSIWPQM